MRAGRIIVATLVAAAWPSCTGTPATPEQVRQEEGRLLQPFLQPLEVGCSELVVEMTSNFHACVAQPAVDAAAHEMRKERGTGFVDTVWTNRVGDPRTRFVVSIGERSDMTSPGVEAGPRFSALVLNRVRFRVYEDERALTLCVRAEGPPLVVREGRTSPGRDVQEFAIEDGVLRCR